MNSYNSCEQQRIVIHLRDDEEYSYEEIEQVTGLSVNNIRVTLSRARRSVREMYIIDADWPAQRGGCFNEIDSCRSIY